MSSGDGTGRAKDRTTGSGRAEQPDHPGQVGLERALSLPLTTFYGLGNILGAGIYVLIGKIVLYAGGYAPLAFLLAAALAALTAFTYAELSARYPYSAGEAVYVEQGLNRPAAARLTGLLIILVGVVSSAAILRGFAGYLQVFFDLPTAAILVIAVLTLGGLAAWGIRQSVGVAALATLIEIGGLLFILAVAAPVALEPEFTPVPERGGLGVEIWQGVFLAAFLAFFAFTGFEDMVNVAEEVRQPERNLPRAILLALLIATLLYLGVAWVALRSLPGEVLGASEAPLALLYQHATGREPVLITAISLFAVINGALIQMIMTSRVVYGMARRGWLPAWLGRVHPVTRTPMIATLLISTVILSMALGLPIETLAKATSYALLVIFTLVNGALWRLKGRSRHPPGILRVPRWVPASGLVASAAFVLVQAVNDLAGT
jgi:amino acid transporter